MAKKPLGKDKGKQRQNGSALASTAGPAAQPNATETGRPRPSYANAVARNSVAASTSSDSPGSSGGNNSTEIISADPAPALAATNPTTAAVNGVNSTSPVPADETASASDSAPVIAPAPSAAVMRRACDIPGMPKPYTSDWAQDAEDEATALAEAAAAAAAAAAAQAAKASEASEASVAAEAPKASVASGSSEASEASEAVEAPETSEDAKVAEAAKAPEAAEASAPTPAVTRPAWSSSSNWRTRETARPGRHAGSGKTARSGRTVGRTIADIRALAWTSAETVQQIQDLLQSTSLSRQRGQVTTTVRRVQTSREPAPAPTPVPTPAAGPSGPSSSEGSSARARNGSTYGCVCSQRQCASSSSSFLSVSEAAAVASASLPLQDEVAADTTTSAAAPVSAPISPPIFVVEKETVESSKDRQKGKAKERGKTKEKGDAHENSNGHIAAREESQVNGDSTEATQIPRITEVSEAAEVAVAPGAIDSSAPVDGNINDNTSDIAHDNNTQQDQTDSSRFLYSGSGSGSGPGTPLGRDDESSAGPAESEPVALMRTRSSPNVFQSYPHLLQCKRRQSCSNLTPDPQSSLMTSLERPMLKHTQSCPNLSGPQSSPGLTNEMLKDIFEKMNKETAQETAQENSPDDSSSLSHPASHDNLSPADAGEETGHAAVVVGAVGAVGAADVDQPSASPAPEADATPSDGSAQPQNSDQQQQGNNDENTQNQRRPPKPPREFVFHKGDKSFRHKKAKPLQYVHQAITPDTTEDWALEDLPPGTLINTPDELKEFLSLVHQVSQEHKLAFSISFHGVDIESEDGEICVVAIKLDLMQDVACGKGGKHHHLNKGDALHVLDTHTMLGRSNIDKNTRRAVPLSTELIDACRVRVVDIHNIRTVFNVEYPLEICPDQMGLCSLWHILLDGELLKLIWAPATVAANLAKNERIQLDRYNRFSLKNGRMRGVWDVQLLESVVRQRFLDLTQEPTKGCTNLRPPGSAAFDTFYRLSSLTDAVGKYLGYDENWWCDKRAELQQYRRNNPFHVSPQASQAFNRHQAYMSKCHTKKARENTGNTGSNHIFRNISQNAAGQEHHILGPRPIRYCVRSVLYLPLLFCVFYYRLQALPALDRPRPQLDSDECSSNKYLADLMKRVRQERVQSTTMVWLERIQNTSRLHCDHIAGEANLELVPDRGPPMTISFTITPFDRRWESAQSNLQDGPRRSLTVFDAEAKANAAKTQRGHHGSRTGSKR